MKLEKRDGYRVLVGGPVPSQASAITLGKTVVVRPECATDEPLMAHEREHVRQFAELGRLRFLWKYVSSYLALRAGGHNHMGAYRRIPLEIDASWHSRNKATSGAGC